MNVNNKHFFCASGCNREEAVEKPHCSEKGVKDEKRKLEKRVNHCKHLSFGGCSPPRSHDMSASSSDEGGVDRNAFYVTDMTKLERKYPPVSLTDTAFIQNGNVRSVHGRGNLFQDEEILKVHDVTESERIGGRDRAPIYAYKTQNGKYVIQQQATRGCTSGVTAMLIKDHGKGVNIFSLVRRNLGKESDKLRDLTSAGLKPIQTNIKNDLNELRELLQQNGSAIISVDGELGSHVVIVDEINKDCARIRDPYHGWEITVTLKALENRFSGGSVIQV